MAREDEDWLSGLNPPQRQAVQHGSDPLLILAGAGSGKTRVITYRVAFLLRQGVEPESILAVTFTNKAANEMRERACQLHPQARFCRISTFHSFCAWYLRRHAELVKLSPHFTIYDEDDCARLVKTVQPQLNLVEQRKTARGLSLLKDRGIAPDDPLLELESPWAVELYPAYERALLEANAVDFGGLILHTLRVLESFPEVAQRTRQRFTHILVDEFQDTNPLQFRLLRLLAPEGHWLTVVGDDDQSIYSFRGAEVTNILDFPKHYPNTHIVKLEQNYRSTGHILAAASAMIAHNRNRMTKTLWTDRGEGDKVQIRWFETDQDEAAWAADFARSNPEHEVAVLYRTNAQSRLFEHALRQAHVPYRLIGGLSFFEREEVKDALAYLAVLVNPRDHLSLRRVVNKPPRGLGPSTVERMFQSWGSQPSLESFRDRSDLRPAARRALAAFVSLIRELDSLRPGRTLQEFLKELYDRTGLLEYYQGVDERDGSDRAGNLGELLSVAVDFDATDQGVSRFLEQAALSRTEDEAPEARVSLITLHNAKGLEFDQVILAGAEEGLLPLGDTEDEVEEERRLFYVGMTRAKRLLTITGADVRQIWGQYLGRKPSPFLGELPREHVEMYGLKPRQSEWAVGDRVWHQEFGPGYIVDIKSRDVHQLLVVRLDNGAMARFIAEYTPLEKIADE